MSSDSLPTKSVRLLSVAALFERSGVGSLMAQDVKEDRILTEFASIIAENDVKWGTCDA